MNKLVKGSIAGAAGIALLLGGAGTLASWNASATVASESAITAGTLNIKAADAGVWVFNNEKVDLKDIKIVPGDKLTYTSTFEVTATGDNLKATADIGKASISALNFESDADVNLATKLETSAAFTVNGKATDAIVTNQGTQKVVVTVTITFPNEGAGDENKAMTGSVNLNDFTVTLSQKN
ncbi:alternate-type signal peptide domain-containing protein [Salinibacterium sp. UTAS2018]|uniref:alternate-type signal peptide domain-containing protein n=1 Tax=Salinibacterium sp. UTAS2018 TaxID=2508880 RepID=UPI0010096488|nr:alternate-type signal peptide domain-containing protein [Salinibacterium sp. UTAS2018]QAV70273.1 alternate-type signal peptide domain-containing protein [Salinibacterium sp. UTAS2018]